MAQASSLSQLGAPAAAIAPIVSLPILIGTPPSPVVSCVSKTAGLKAPHHQYGRIRFAIITGKEVRMHEAIRFWPRGSRHG